MNHAKSASSAIKSAIIWTCCLSAVVIMLCLISLPRSGTNRSIIGQALWGVINSPSHPKAFHFRVDQRGVTQIDSTLDETIQENVILLTVYFSKRREGVFFPNIDIVHMQFIGASSEYLVLDDATSRQVAITVFRSPVMTKLPPQFQRAASFFLATGKLTFAESENDADVANICFVIVCAIFALSFLTICYLFAAETINKWAMARNKTHYK